MRIKKFQVGGVAYTPFIPQGAAQQQVAQEASSGSSGGGKSSSSKKSNLENDIIKILEENGLPSDVNMFLKVADSFLKRSESLSDSTLFGGSDDTYSMSDLITLQRYANEIKFNKGIYDKAVTNLEAENAWSDYAIDSNGYFYVYTENGLEKATAEEVSKVLKGESDKKFSLLTYSQLAGLRERGIAFNADILKDLQGAVGSESTINHIADLIQKFSKNKTGSVETKSTAIARGLEYMVQNGPDGYYKITTTDQIRDINDACVMLWQNLTGADQNNIKRNMTISGKDPKSTKDLYAELSNMVYRFAEQSSDPQFDKSSSEYNPKQTGEKGGSNLTQDNYLQMFANGRLEFEGYRTISPHHDNTEDKGAMTVPVFAVGAPIDRQFNTLGMMNLDNFRKTCWAIQGTNSENFVIGDKALTSDQMSALVYDGYSELKVAMIPVKPDGKGRQVPDFERIGKYNEIKAALKNNPDMNDMALAELCRSKGIDPKTFDRNTGNIIAEDTMPFLTFTAIVGEDTMGDIDELKKYMEHVDKDRGKRMVDKYNKCVQYGSLDINKNSKKINDLSSSDADELYEASVYVPVPSAYRGMLLSGIGEYISKHDLTDYAGRSAARAAEVANSEDVLSQHPDVRKEGLGQFNE